MPIILSLSNKLFIKSNIKTIFFVLGSASIDIKSVDTSPISLGRVLAAGYSSVVATTTIQVQQNDAQCYWEYDENFRSNIYFHNRNCLSNNNWNARSTCSRSGDLVTSNFVFLQPLQNGQFTVRVKCENQTKVLPSITVKSKKTKYRIYFQKFLVKK